MRNGLWLSGLAWWAMFIPVMAVAIMVCVAGYRQARRER